MAFATLPGGVAAASIALSCGLPHGDAEPPDTAPPNVTRTALLEIVAPTGLALGEIVPLSIEGSVAPLLDGAPQSELCVSLWAKPGIVIFPFGARCATIGAGGNVASDAALGDASRPDAEPVSNRCLATRTLANGWAGGSAVAAYLPSGSETTATVFGALYANGTCTGEAIAEEGVVLPLGAARVEAGVAGATDGAKSDVVEEPGSDGDAASTNEQGRTDASAGTEGGLIDAATPADGGGADASKDGED